MATSRNRSSILWGQLESAQPRLLALAVGIGILTWAYWANLQYLYTIWENEPNYSHGVLVVPIALVICWQRLADTKTPWRVSKGPWWSWTILITVLVARAFAYERNNLWFESVTLIPTAACLLLTLGGWPLLERGWPAVTFLVFMLPLPSAINGMVSLPLQRIATLGSVFVMQLTGLRAMADGNVIHLLDAPPDSRTLEVALACNGLSMLMTLAATVTATIILVPLPTWKRIVVLASALPIALVSNIIRILATGWCYNLIEGEGAKKLAHDWSGWLMMPLALILVGFEVWILSWLAGDGGLTPDVADRPLLAMFPPDQR
jgi:exosortase